LDIHPTNEDLVMTGGADSNAVLFNRTTGKIVDTLKGHKKKITSVKFHPTEKAAFTTSLDNTSTIWGYNNSAGKYTAQHTLKDHSAEVSGCTLHPSGSYLITASMDKTWCFYDVARGTCLQQVKNEKVTAGYTKVSFHPDGLILGAGTADSIVRIFDVKAQKNVANFKGHTGKVTALSFSENGYYLASGDEEGVVKCWDLRKLKDFQTIDLKSDAGCLGLEFDRSGSYLGVVGDEVSMYTSKKWELVKTWKDHKKDVTAIKFGQGAEWFATTSLDRSLKIYSA